MKYRGVTIALISLGAFAASLSAERLLHYTFDESGERIPNHGAIGREGDLRMYDGIGVNAELRTPEGAGVNGRALRIGRTHEDFGSFGHCLPGPLSLSAAFTITGWLKMEAMPSHAVILRQLHLGKGFSLDVLTEGGLSALQLTLNETALASAPVFRGSEWLFFAVTWSRGPAGEGEARFYRGLAGDGSLELVGEVTYTGDIEPPARGGFVVVGNSVEKYHPMEGSLDELSLYDTCLDEKQLTEAMKSSQ